MRTSNLNSTFTQKEEILAKKLEIFESLISIWKSTSIQKGEKSKQYFNVSERVVKYGLR